MKKLILVLTTVFICGVLFTGCKTSETNPNNLYIGTPSSTELEIDKYFNYVVIADSIDQRIVVDKNTGVMYYQIVNDSMTPIYNSDGSVMIYDENN